MLPQLFEVLILGTSDKKYSEQWARKIPGELELFNLSIVLKRRCG
jgi:hypothetical protein